MLGVGAPAGEWVKLPPQYGRAEARWTAGKGEAGVRLRAKGRDMKGSVGKKPYNHRRFRWQGDFAESGQLSLQAGRVWVWLKEGRRLGDRRWEAHHRTKDTAAAAGGRHVKQGGVVVGTAKRTHAKGHAREGGLAKAAKAKATKARTIAKVKAMNKARSKTAAK